MNKPKKTLRNIPGTFLDKDGHPYYYDAKTKTAYFIAQKDLKLAEVLAYRPYIAISAAVVLYSLLQGSIAYYIGLAVVLFALLEWTYRRSILKKCKRVTPYSSPRNQRQDAMNSQKQSLLILKSVGYLAAAGLIAWTILDQKNEGASLAVLLLMIGISLIGAYQNINILIKRK